MRNKFLILPFLFIGIGFGGCGKDSEKSFSRSSIIEFKNLEVKEAQQLVQGKWRVYEECGGFQGKCHDLIGVYHEYIGNKFSEQNGGSISENKITEWTKTAYGCRVVFEKAKNTVPYHDYLYLEYLINDTLYFGDNNYDGLGGVAVRVK